MENTGRRVRPYFGAGTRFCRVRGRAKITSHFPAGSFGRGLRCSLLTDPWAGYARRSRLAGGQNSRAVKYEFIFARPLNARAKATRLKWNLPVLGHENDGKIKPPVSGSPLPAFYSLLINYRAASSLAGLPYKFHPISFAFYS